MKYWTGCHHHPNLIGIEKENCDCTYPDNVLIENPDGNIETLLEIGLLPNRTGDRIDFNPTAIPSAIPTDTSSGLSTGAKAGIGVGVTIAILLLIAGAVFMFFRRRRRGEKPPAYTEDAEMDGSSGSHLEKAEIQRSELTANHKSELSPDTMVTEMPSPAEKFSQLPSPQREPMELDSTAGYFAPVGRPSTQSEPVSEVRAPTTSRFIEETPTTAVSSIDQDRPAFQSPFDNEAIVSPEEQSFHATPRGQQLKGSRAFSVASPAAERKAAPRTDNPGSIPTAGGFDIGERSRASQRQKRERSANKYSREDDIREV